MHSLKTGDPPPHILPPTPSAEIYEQSLINFEILHAGLDSMLFQLRFSNCAKNHTRTRLSWKRNEKTVFGLVLKLLNVCFLWKFLQTKDIARQSNDETRDFSTDLAKMVPQTCRKYRRVHLRFRRPYIRSARVRGSLFSTARGIHGSAKKKKKKLPDQILFLTDTCISQIIFLTDSWRSQITF